jgi:hypothetical protein
MLQVWMNENRVGEIRPPCVWDLGSTEMIKRFHDEAQRLQCADKRSYYGTNIAFIVRTMLLNLMRF